MDGQVEDIPALDDLSGIVAASSTLDREVLVVFEKRLERCAKESARGSCLVRDRGSRRLTMSPACKEERHDDMWIAIMSIASLSEHRV